MFYRIAKDVFKDFQQYLRLTKNFIYIENYNKLFLIKVSHDTLH